MAGGDARCRILAVLVSVIAVSTARPGDDGPDSDSPAITIAPTESELRKELLRRSANDQDVRRKLIEVVSDRGLDWGEAALLDPVVQPLAAEMSRVDGDNCKWLRSVVDERGWPLISEVGRDGANAAFLIVQHANADLDFQKRCLGLMTTAPNGQVALPDLALLTDRVRLAEGKKQLYGSQVVQKDGRWIVRPTEGRENLDRRRATMGLPSMAEYLKLLEKVYGPETLKPDDGP